MLELTQETDNPTGALYLATKKFGFSVWGVFPEWQPREIGPEEYTNKWLAAERFLEKPMDSTSFENSIDSNVFTPKMPSLLGTDHNIQISFSDNVAFFYQGDQLIATCKIDNGVRRFGHIQFWSVKLEPGCNLEAAEQFLREVAMLTKNQFKKIEIFSHDSDTIKIIENLGFHCRGQKHASCKIEDTYYNQTGSDLSFYNIEDAKKVLEKSKNFPDLNDFALVLDHCKEEINKALEQKIVDEYGQTYLENLAFQMVREVHSEHLYSEENAPWSQLIKEIPDELNAVKSSLISLAEKLNLNLNLNVTKENNCN